MSYRLPVALDPNKDLATSNPDVPCRSGPGCVEAPMWYSLAIRVRWPGAQDKEISTMPHKEESVTLHSEQSSTVVSRRKFLSAGSAAITAVGANLLLTPIA